MEAANYVYSLSLDLNLTTISEVSIDSRIHISSGESIAVEVTGSPVEIQWRTWDMRDNWMNHVDFVPGDQSLEISHSMIVNRLKYLPGNQIEGNQTLMARAILGDNASTNLVIHLFITDPEPLPEDDGSETFLNLMVTVLATLVVFILFLLSFTLIIIRGEYLYDDW